MSEATTPGPRRTCVGCRRVRPQDRLVRITRSADGSLRVGRTLPGRGAWLCRSSPECFALALRQGGFSRAFRTAVPAAHVEALRTELVGPAPSAATPFVPGTQPARD